MHWSYIRKVFIDGEFSEPLSESVQCADFENEVLIKLNKGFMRAVLFDENALIIITNIDNCVKSCYIDIWGEMVYKTFNHIEYSDLLLNKIIHDYDVVNPNTNHIAATLMFYGFMEDNSDKMYNGDIMLINKLIALSEIQCRYYIDMIREMESVINGFAKRAEH